jgi:hypothetical protein
VYECKAYRLLVGHEHGGEALQLGPADDLLAVHLGEHQSVRGVARVRVQLAQALVLHRPTPDGT